MTRVVVVGNGMAGSRLAQELVARRTDRPLEVTVIGAETHPAYNRILLSAVLAGAATADGIGLAAPGWAADAGVQLRLGVTVAAVDRDGRAAVTSEGERVPYDVLVLATGSQALIPPLAGVRDADGDLRAGVVAFRTLEDCARIVARVRDGGRSVVLGGGLLGLEAARGLAERGQQVTVVHREAHLMERQLDAGAGRVLARTLGRLGVDVVLGASASAVRGDAAVEGLELADGRVLPADLLVLACGVVPDTGLARSCGLAVERGVVVDDELRTSDPRIHAIGECAQHAGEVYGLVAPAWEQAAVLAEVLTGGSAGYAGSQVVTRLKAAGVDLASLGDATATGDDDGSEVVQFLDPARGTYKKVVIRDGRLVGAILLGDVATVGRLTQLLDRSAPVPADPLGLLFAGPRGGPDGRETPALMPDRATVCRCNGVDKRAVTACWLAGGRTVADVAAATRATTGCGTCRPVVEGLLEWLAETGTTERSDCA